ncbi:peptidoglycan D,D-transpeptidase FtsI family protein [Niallia endozanthoxylica]|uniref:serine-type D-Ala-D-Ala carboxypeptidase n=1 Tax=Niallia endozanthoxylica TaxID=2036016 RepID=A0A5J5HWA3_9BACI|nr:penicillin-binding protein 2 [Niallia endozanthoxylica]KAA9026391.1 penicillin-binding protein 2 [Niallia endozanthoxylica]
MWRTRAIIMIGFCLVCFALLIGRLMQLQLFETEHFSKHGINLLEESVSQRSQAIVIDSGRGGFLDKNGKALTHQNIPVLILFPFLKKTDWDVQKVASIIGVSSKELINEVEEAKVPFAFGGPEPLQLTKKQMEEINQQKIPGVFAVEKKFDIDTNPAEHVIGITGENETLLKKRYPDKKVSPKTSIGLTGLEKSFDEFLLPEGEAKLVYHVDASGGPLFGINVKYVEPANPFYPINIRTTIDSSLQHTAEELVDKHGIKKGGLVLLDIETNTVLSMVSRPKINKNDPFNEKTSGTQNLMLKQQITGSVFKTVVAAAAIENQIDDTARLFDCSRKINGDIDSHYQYGQLNMMDSFAKSCNNTFATLAKELQTKNPNILEEFAKKLSFVGPSGWEGDIYHYENFKQLPEEDNGRVFLSDEARTDRNFVGLTGIGQHEVRATPLAVANMMATIARGGKKELVRAASAIEYKNGTSLLTFKEKNQAGEKISSYTATKLQRLLRHVVTHDEGTGRWFENLPYEVAGKSGTGETGKFMGGVQLHNKWFAGYFPYQNPRYALVVVNLDVLENEGGVNLLYSDMVKSIYEYDQTQ